ncbi:hypothetical protein KTE91_03450 [Burkholderia multivorans]|uniref:hypothetical protein n=1 Tax=Burkholderia multivorans TaxID=87883 RepID=UPI001C243340|nr:hypothetical protein [Burkholderia multivorans]MBU9434138.1 hypothetical protein [Burkholderia multivorans]
MSYYESDYTRTLQRQYEKSSATIQSLIQEYKAGVIQLDEFMKTVEQINSRDCSENQQFNDWKSGKIKF